MSRAIVTIILIFSGILAQSQIRILNFQADSGFEHKSKAIALKMVEGLGAKNGWEVITSVRASSLNDETLSNIDVLLFNNNCGTDGPIFSTKQQEALQRFIKNGGGFVGIHCAGAIWKEDAVFQQWYEGLIGTRLVGHPQVQEAKLLLENQDHIATAHLPKEWSIKDEWHFFSSNPRGKVNVLLSLDESSYEAEPELKMGSDHPFTWYHYYDGGRSFFTSLGHTIETYQNPNYQKMIEGGILWASGYENDENDLNGYGLILDLDADKSILTNERGEVQKWINQVSGFSAKEFMPNPYGVRITKPDSGSPFLKEDNTDLNGHNSVVFKEDELINGKEDAFDHLITGSGFTWFVVIQPYSTQSPDERTEFAQHRLEDVNSFMGNLRNGGNYEGFWGNFEDDLTFWAGARNGVTFGRFDKNNPKVVGLNLDSGKFHIIGARMVSGKGEVPISLYINSPNPIAKGTYPVNVFANASKLAIGTERDATNHPGSESFDGEIARILIYERPLSEEEIAQNIQLLKSRYSID
ncbi:MAG: ThuA domain-containing protein [Bacteroidota bacterium]